MKILDTIPILWFSLRNEIKLIIKKFKCLFQNTKFHLEYFDFEYINSKGIMVIHYKTRGLFYIKIQNLKIYKGKGRIVLNLENLDVSKGLQIIFFGHRKKHTEIIEVIDVINSQYNTFRPKFLPNIYDLQKFKIKNTGNFQKYSLHNTSTINQTPKYKIR
ncbi:MULTISPECIES: hypothetical protein [unclassified Sphingobacterium]|uniref:hypothetical protein n=1 Tax=unclassified Sphingobacterium TaxID=2609468 RepID=UPI0020C52A02|nr:MULTISPECIES: hypothetical protein [unclassified Sphingobacterium]